MSPNTEALIEAALQLPQEDRLAMVSRLLESMPESDLFFSEDDPQFIDELNRRVADTEGMIDAKDLLGES